MQSGIPLDTSSHSFKQLCLFKAWQIANLQRKPGQDSSTQADPHQRLNIDTKGKEKSKEYIPYEGQSHITHESHSCWIGHWPPLHKERQHLAPEASIFTHRQQQLQSLLLLQKQQLQVAAQLGTRVGSRGETFHLDATLLSLFGPLTMHCTNTHTCRCMHTCIYLFFLISVLPD